MNIDPILISEVVDKIMESGGFIGGKTKRNIEYHRIVALERVIKYLNTGFNNRYVGPISYTDTYKHFFIKIVSHQCGFFHPLTCGINSEHELLVPRVSVSGFCFLVCPSCGYIQSGE